jgi:hypothetical protein
MTDGESAKTPKLDSATFSQRICDLIKNRRNDQFDIPQQQMRVRVSQTTHKI